MASNAPLHGRHRDKNGEISRKHGNTLIGTLRKIYGAKFAQGFKDSDKLSDVLQTVDDESLSQLARDHEAGTLHKKLVDIGDKEAQLLPGHGNTE